MHAEAFERLSAAGGRTDERSQPRHIQPTCGVHARYAHVINKTDPLYYPNADEGEPHQHFWDHPDMWAVNGRSARGFVHIAYDSNENSGRKWDKRVSYYNPKYPWIEAMHYFHNPGDRAREWDAARITMPAKRHAQKSSTPSSRRYASDLSPKRHSPS